MSSKKRKQRVGDGVRVANGARDNEIIQKNWDQLRARHPHLAGAMEIPGWQSENHYFFRHPLGILLKFPRTLQGAHRLPVQTALLEKLAPRFPIPLPAPPPEYVFDTAKAWEERFVGYPPLDGEAFSNDGLRQRSASTDRVADLVAATFSKLHAFPVEEISDIGLDHATPETIRTEFEGLLEFGLTEQLFPRPEDKSRFEQFLAGFLNERGNFRWVPTLVHGDFFNGAVTDKGARNLTALWNWGEASINDPAQDLYRSVLHFGESFGRSVLRSYKGSEDPDALWRRMIFYLHLPALEGAMLFALEELGVFTVESGETEKKAGVNGNLQVLADQSRYFRHGPLTASPAPRRGSLLGQARTLMDRAKKGR